MVYQSTTVPSKDVYDAIAMISVSINNLAITNRSIAVNAFSDALARFGIHLVERAEREAAK